MSEQYLHVVYTAMSGEIRGLKEFLLTSFESKEHWEAYFVQAYDLQSTFCEHRVEQVAKECTETFWSALEYSSSKSACSTCLNDLSVTWAPDAANRMVIPVKQYWGKSSLFFTTIDAYSSRVFNVVVAIDFLTKYLNLLAHPNQVKE